MSRYPPLAPDNITGDQLELHNHIDGICTKIFGSGGAPPFIMKDSNGALVGPFPLLIHNTKPLLGKGVFDYIMYLTSHSLLTARERELAILAAGSFFRCTYELYAHSLVAAKTGLSEQQVRDAAGGKIPEELGDREKIVSEFANQLLEGKGAMGEDVFGKAAEAMGKDAVLALVQLVSVYSYVCLMLNAGAVDVPEEAKAENGVA